MTSFESDSDPLIVKSFLDNPESRRNRNAFCDLCGRHILTSIRVLAARGWRAPGGGGPDELANAAATVLSDFLAPPGQRPFKAVFDYFVRIGMRRGRGAEPDQLLYRLIGQIKSFVRQKVGQLGDADDSQIVKIKRSYKDAIRHSDYRQFERNGAPCVIQSDAASDPGEERPDLPYAELYRIAYDVASRSQSRTERCRRFFAVLAQQDQYRRFVPKWAFIRAMVDIDLSFVDAFAPRPAHPGEAVPGLMSAVSLCTSTALEWVEGNGLRAFVKKGRVTEAQGNRFLTAVELYLADLIHSETASLHQYFRETMPEELDALYMDQYKYPFETTLREAEERFRECMKENLH